MTHPLRSLVVGDVDHYPSEYIFGVVQGMTLLGHWITTVNVRQPIEIIAKRFEEVHPDIAWMHMMLWSPMGEAHAWQLMDLCAEWRRRGARVLLHDGDARVETRFPHDLSEAVDLVLCNHTVPRTPWKVPQLHWPYGAFFQAELAAPCEEFACDLAFAGRMGGGLYDERTTFVLELQRRLGSRMRLWPSATVRHTLFRTPEVAASAGAVLGYGRPELPGWTDVRVFQYPGAGGVLLHDDAEEWLTPWVHYLPYTAGSVESVEAALDEVASRNLPALRRDAFRYVQAHHSSLVRVRQALKAVALA